MQQRWALVTGASSGFGLDFAKALAKRGYSTVLTARRKDRMDELAGWIREETRQEALVFEADLSKAEAREALFRFVQSRDLFVEVLINNAGFGMYAPFLESGRDAHLDMIDVNVSAVVELTHRFAEPMKRRKRGAILFTSSIAATAPIPLYATYSATKAFISHFGGVVREEFAPLGIQVTVTEPGMADTEFFERAGQPELRFQKWTRVSSETVVHASLDALFNGKAFVTVGGLNRASMMLSRVLSRPMQSKTAGFILKK